MPGARDITFPGCPDSVCPSWMKAVLRRMHINLGHPTNASLVRQLAQANATAPALYGARMLRCAVCLWSQPPRQPRPGKLFVAKRFLDRLMLDIMFVPDVTGFVHAFLSALDDASTLHALKRVLNRTEKVLWEALLTLWLQP